MTKTKQKTTVTNDFETNYHWSMGWISHSAILQMPLILCVFFPVLYALTWLLVTKRWVTWNIWLFIWGLCSVHLVILSLGHWSGMMAITASPDPILHYTQHLQLAQWLIGFWLSIFILLTLSLRVSSGLWTTIVHSGVIIVLGSQVPLALWMLRKA